MRKGKGSLVTVLSDIERGNLIEMIDSHRQQDIIEFLIKQPFELREQVEEVSIDMWEDFQKLENKYSQMPKLSSTVFT